MVTQERNDLALACLDELTPVIANLATRVGIEFDDAYQESLLVIIKILDRHPCIHGRLIPYVVTSIKYRMLDIYKRKSKHIGVLSLDMDMELPDDACTMGDFLPSSFSIDPLLVVLQKEHLGELYSYTQKPPQCRQRALIAERWQEAALALIA